MSIAIYASRIYISTYMYLVLPDPAGQQAECRDEAEYTGLHLGRPVGRSELLPHAFGKEPS